MPVPTRYVFTNVSDEDIFLSGVNVTIKAGETKVFTPVEIDDIEEYFDYPEVVNGKLIIHISGDYGKDIILAGSVTFAQNESQKSVTFTAPVNLPYSISLVADTNVNVYYTNKTSTGFKINLSAAPDEGETYTVDYIVIKQNL